MYELLDGSADASEDRQLVDWIDRKGGAVTVREVQMGCRWLKSPGAAAAALDKLVEGGFGAWQAPQSENKRGPCPRTFATSTVNEFQISPGENEDSVDVDVVDPSESPASDGGWGEL